MLIDEDQNDLKYYNYLQIDMEQYIQVQPPEQSTEKQALPNEKPAEPVRPPRVVLISQGKAENSHHFSRELNSFYCDFYLQEGESLKIVLTSQLDASTYELSLSKESKKQHEELNFFQTIDEIYEYLLENTQQATKSDKQALVNIEQNGRISIIVISTIGKKQRHRTIFLETEKATQNREAYLENVVKKIGKSVLELKKEMQNAKQRQEIALKLSSQLLEKLKLYGTKFHFASDRSDIHYGKFKEVDRRITKVGDNTTYFSLYADTPIPKNENSYFNVKLGSTLSRNIMIGLGSKFTKGIPNVYSHQDFIGFYLYEGGYVWEKGNQRDLLLKNYPIEQGCTITTNINLTQGYVNWQICGVRVAYSVIPSELKAKLLFPVILMINVNDCLQIDL